MDEETKNDITEKTFTTADLWKERVKAILIACAMCAALIWFSAWLVHKPTIVYPPEMESQFAEMRAISADARPVNKELLDSLEKAYGLDKDCTVGKKYGAVCQDGTITYSDGEAVCDGHGGAKAWAECK